MAEKIVVGIIAFAALGAATILLIGYGELRAARQCYSIVDGGALE